MSEHVSIEIEPATTFAEETHKYISAYIQQADNKAAFIFTIGAALLAFLYHDKLTERWLKIPTTWSFGDFLAFLAMLGLAGATFFAVAVVIPRLKGSRRGYIFWKSIACFDSATQYSEAVFNLEPIDLAQAKLEHCYELSIVCQRKYLLLNLSILTGVIGFTSTVMYLFFFQ